MRLLLLPLALAVALLACSSGADDVPPRGDCFNGRLPDGTCKLPPDAPGEYSCNPLSQVGCMVGEKCTWIIDQTEPSYAGHIACVADGTVSEGAPCMFGAPGATGFDNCRKGSVCSAFTHTGEAGTCKQICDDQGGPPVCDASHACVTEQPLFSTGTSSPAAAGVCETACDPLADNDFDGSGSALSRSGSACGSATVGCYGTPSHGTAPATTFECLPDLHYTTPLRHRTECTAATGCADPDGTIRVNSCNQGYLPVVIESTANQTVVCIAMCKPVNCYAGHCGSNDADSHGAAPHRCQSRDALGAFGSGENCEYLWREEIDGMGAYQPSAWSDSVGLCFDHTKYLYDPDANNHPSIPYPRCEELQLQATGSDPTQPLTYFGAVDFGCVDSATAGRFTGKPPVPRAFGLRGLYHRAVR